MMLQQFHQHNQSLLHQYITVKNITTIQLCPQTTKQHQHAAFTGHVSFIVHHGSLGQQWQIQKARNTYHNRTNESI